MLYFVFAIKSKGLIPKWPTIMFEYYHDNVDKQLNNYY